ncbi:hypothetical protein ACHAWX_007110 [Stephanocyclus meneghinianus]
MNRFDNLRQECLLSTELIFRKKLNWLLVFAPIAILGKSGLLGESSCFVLAGLALIPLAERLSFVTEEVAGHTTQTIGALLNATFGNAPELLISSAALREGFYRVVQLTLLGSMLTNLLFVFGLSCLIGGLRFQVQELRITTGNASIGMLMLAVAGLALPAALMLSDEMVVIGEQKQYVDKNGDGISDINDGPSTAMIGFSRFNAVVMVLGYLMYLLFQLGSHQDEFEDMEDEETVEEDVERNHEVTGTVGRIVARKKARKNIFCGRLFGIVDDTEEVQPMQYERVQSVPSESSLEIELPPSNGSHNEFVEQRSTNSLPSYIVDKPIVGSHRKHHSHSDIGRRRLEIDDNTVHSSNVSARKRKPETLIGKQDVMQGSRPQDEPARPRVYNKQVGTQSAKSHCSDGSEEEPPTMIPVSEVMEQAEESHMTFRMGLLWLSIITLSISVMSDILVDTIDGFAYKYGISEVFTSLVILPYFSNIAEQVSAVIFAYRNEMDLCIGITVGSAVQIALFVLPGSVIIGWVMDRSMSLFFRGFETCCLIFSVVSVAAVLQGGTTNWLVGVYLLGVYFMIAAGFWFHELENLSIDGELEGGSLHNQTSIMYPRLGSSH